MPPPFTVRAQDQPGVDLGYWDHGGNIAIPGNLIVGGNIISGAQFAVGTQVASEVNDLLNRVAALEAFNAQTPGLVYQFGLAANIGPAALGNAMYFATDTGELWVPGNAVWYKVALTIQTLTSGGANPPTGFAAVVQPDNTTACTWTLPTPPSGYAIGAVTVREAFQSPGGLAGMPLAGSATSYTVPAITAASTAEYYVTVTFTKSATPNLESAQSTHVDVSYPSAAGPVTSTFGQTTIGANTSVSSADKMNVSKFTPAASGTLSAAHARLWLSAAGATCKTKFIVFADNAGVPGAKIAESAEIIITNTAAAVIDYTFSGANAAAVTAGTPVHIGVAWQAPSAGNLTWSRANTAAQAFQQSGFTYPTVPASYGTATTASGPIDVYVDTVATASGGGGGLLTPAQILGIGTSTFWYLTLDRAPAAGGELTPTLAQLSGGYVNSPYFYVNATGDAVCMSTVASASTTQNSPHPRTELREEDPQGNLAAWTATGTAQHIMFGTSTVTFLPPDAESSSVPKPQVCFAQIHDGAGDVVRLQVENSGSTPSDAPGGSSVANLHIVCHTHSPNGSAGTEVKTSIQSAYTLGTAINWRIEVIGNTCNIYLGGTITGTVGNWVWSGGTKVFSFTISGTGFYFKAGDYQQFSTFVTNSSGNPDGGYLATSKAITEVKRLAVFHTSYA